MKTRNMFLWIIANGLVGALGLAHRSPSQRRAVMRSRQSTPPIIWFVLMVGTLVLGFMSAGTVAAAAKNTPICKLEDGGYVLRMVTDAQYTRAIADGSGEWKAVLTVYTDADKDGYGTGAPMLACEQTPDLALVAGDCDDTDPTVNPAAVEIPGNGRDDDCNPATTDEVGCPCDGHEAGGVTWGASFTTQYCGELLLAHFAVVDTGNNALWAAPSTCQIVSQVGGSVVIFYTLDGQSLACRTSLERIAAADGITCGNP